MRCRAWRFRYLIACNTRATICFNAVRALFNAFYVLLHFECLMFRVTVLGSQKFWFPVRPYPSGCCMDAASVRMWPRTMVPPLVPAEKVTLMSCVWTVPQSIFPVVISVNDAMIVRCLQLVCRSWWQQSWWFLRWSVVALGFGCIATDMQKYGKAQVLPALWRSSWGHRCQSFCSYVTRWWQSVYSYNIMQHFRKRREGLQEMMEFNWIR